MAFDKAKFLAKFIDEAGEHIRNLNDGILFLEKSPDDTEKLNELFRSAHTIKGSSRMMKLIPLSELAHKLEDVLDSVRKKKIQQTESLINLLLEGVRAIESLLGRISAGEESAEPPAEICMALENAALHGMAEKAVLPEKKAVLPEKKIAETKNHAGTTFGGDALKPDEKSVSDEKKPVEILRIGSDKLDELIKLMGEIVSGHSRSKQKMLEIREIEQSAKKHLEWIYSMTDQTEWLEKDRAQMFNNAESLYLSLKRFVSYYREDQNVQSLLIGDLQDRSLKMRMLPLSTIFDSFRLTVRNIAADAGKSVNFIVEGGHTELDKKIIEQIGDSLLHMIRNSIDHGIEESEIRLQAGKPEIGTIRLSAEYDGGSVAIGISDDGAGICVAKLKEKALEKGIHDEESLRSLTEADIIHLIFEPGFSTSETITDLSGRGVGMDVVRKNIIDNLKGSIHIENKEGKGTSFHIKLPLTMAIVHVLTVIDSGMIFAVPTNFIREIIKIPSGDLIRVTDRKAVRLRDRILPVMHLREILMLPDENENQTESEKTEYLTLIAAIGNEEFGLVVDSLHQEEDAVIKPLPTHMANIRFVSGCIISGTNEIVNVLHIPGIIAQAKEMKKKSPIQNVQNVQKAQKAQKGKRESFGMKRVLIVDDSVNTREIEKGILESSGYHVSLAGDGMEGFEKAENETFDLIISDVEMPRMDGFSFTEKLRRHKKYRETPVILVTSLDKEEDRIKGMQAGADILISKGDFEQTTLLEAVRSLIG